MNDREREQKYKEVLRAMTPEKQYTAAELGVAPASMTAMVNRGMVIKIAGKPMKYMRPGAPKSVLKGRIAEVLKDYPDGSMFNLCKNGYAVGCGKLCVVKNGEVVDLNDYGKIVNPDNFDYLLIKGKKIELKLF